MADDKSLFNKSVDTGEQEDVRQNIVDNVLNQQDAVTNAANQTFSRRQQKKLLKRQKWLESKPERKALEKEKRKAKLAKRKAEEPDRPTYSESRKRINNSYVKKEKSPINVVFDMGFGDKMNQRDRGKCLKQILHCYSLNRRFDHPMNLHVTNFNGVMKEEMSRNNGYENWDIQFHEKSHTDVFMDDKQPETSKKNIVYLSSESENVISGEFEPDKTYVIGALVDHNLHKGLCYRLAKEVGISHARLPIDEFVILKTRKVLAIDHVFHIIGSVVSQKMTWKDAFLNILPDRKGAEAKQEQDSDGESKNGNLCNEGQMSEENEVSVAT